MYDEFYEVVARMYNGREWLRQPKAVRNADDAPIAFAKGFDAWLAEFLVPPLLAAIKARKKVAAKGG